MTLCKELLEALSNARALEKQLQTQEEENNQLLELLQLELAELQEELLEARRKNNEA